MGLAERHTNTADLTHWRGEIPVNYVYTVGRAGEKFFKAIVNGHLTAVQCPACHVVYLPPRTYCEKCFARLEGHDVKVPAKGQVHTFTACHKKMDGSPTKAPVVVAMITIDGTDGGLVHCLGEVEHKDVYIGMPVEAVFKPKKQRKGSILDIKYFRPKK